MLSSKDDQFLRSRQPFFLKWYLGDIIGEGSSGTVYEITDSEGNHCALKIIPITINDGTNSLTLQNQNSISTEAYLEEITSEILSEVRVMQTLEHNGGIVKYHEYDVIEAPDSSSRFILIKMDLLQPLNRTVRIRESEFSEREVVTMGIDLLTSLSECRKHNIIHRDIKPSNIFVTEDNRYLLGDFGSARLLEKTMMASHKGTLAYMAPEIAAGQTFNSTVDIYSLGIMMYQLLNNCRLPFLNDSFKFTDIEAAVEKRLSGALLPCPENADEELGKIIRKMCAYSPKDRYTSPEECLKDLKDYLKYGKSGRKNIIKIKPLAISAILLVLLLLAGSTFIKTSEPESTVGITSGNVNSSGAIASDNNWLYYSQDVSGERGIRVSKDGSQKEVLCNYTMHDINVTDDYLVFSSRCTPIDTPEGPSYTYITGLYRMNKDGSDFTCLDNDSSLNPVVYGEYVYYFKCIEDSNILSRIPITGGTAETLAEFDKYTFHFYPYEDQLYIYDNEAYQLIALDPDKGTKTVIINQSIGDFCIENGLLYCSPPGPKGFNNEIYIHKINASAPTAINLENAAIITFPYPIYEFNVSNDVIYATSNVTASWNNEADRDGIWRVNNDGSDLEQIYTGNAVQLQIIDESLYFEDNADIYRMDLDGKNLSAFEDITLFYMLD